MSSLLFHAIITFLLLNEFRHFAGAEVPYGVTYSRLANNLPPARDAIDLCEKRDFQKIRIYSPHRDALEALKDQGLEVILGVDNEDIVKMGYEPNFAAQWVKTNVEPYIEPVNIMAIAVGTALIPNHRLASFVLPAMKALKGALLNVGLGRIYVTTPFQLSALSQSFPPSSGTFDPKFISIIRPILDFLEGNSTLLLCDIYPHLSYQNDPIYKGLPLDYALLNSTEVIVRDHQLGYTNMLDGLIDAFYFAMEKLGVKYVRILVSETGWPASHGSTSLDSVKNAETYTANLFKRLKAAAGTPKKTWPLEIFIYNLFRQMNAPRDKQQLGLFYPNQTVVYNF